jgi:hypothetical protein
VLRLLVIPSGSCLGQHSGVAIFKFELTHDVRNHARPIRSGSSWEAKDFRPASCVPCRSQAES